VVRHACVYTLANGGHDARAIQNTTRCTALAPQGSINFFEIDRSKAIISFRNAGGSVVAGIQIGESIRLKGFTTVVAGTARCASACAIAWLGGTPRLMSPQARVGFHAAYSSETGQETGVGNALVGAYLDKIGLPYSAVIYITQAAPNSMTWLSIADSEKQGIGVELLGSGPVDADAADAKEAMLVTPADREEARRKALAAIKVDDLVLDDVTLSVLVRSEGHFLLKGIVTNNSKHRSNILASRSRLPIVPIPRVQKTTVPRRLARRLARRRLGHPYTCHRIRREYLRRLHGISMAYRNRCVV
jgi:hypothetical protein